MPEECGATLIGSDVGAYRTLERPLECHRSVFGEAAAEEGSAPYARRPARPDDNLVNQAPA